MRFLKCKKCGKGIGLSAPDSLDITKLYNGRKITPPCRHCGENDWEEVKVNKGGSHGQQKKSQALRRSKRK